jgi:hypothetical protein
MSFIWGWLVGTNVVGDWFGKMGLGWELFFFALLPFFVLSFFFVLTLST